MCLEPFGRLATGEIGATLAVNLAAPVALATRSAVALPMRICHGQVINVSSGAAQTAQQVTPS
jgi:short-subunit dehydrogenase involved in D-alanine esterification of teichoic acids